MRWNGLDEKTNKMPIHLLNAAQIHALRTAQFPSATGVEREPVDTEAVLMRPCSFARESVCTWRWDVAWQRLRVAWSAIARLWALVRRRLVPMLATDAATGAPPHPGVVYEPVATNAPASASASPVPLFPPASDEELAQVNAHVSVFHISRIR